MEIRLPRRHRRVQRLCQQHVCAIFSQIVTFLTAGTDVTNSIDTPTGYGGLMALGNSAINAPLDCDSRDTYMGVKIFDPSNAFDPALCAAACTATSDYNRQHPAADGSYQSCNFFNTFVLYNNSQSVGQYCSMYNETWSASFATNNGQWRGNDYFNIAYSYTFTNTTAKANRLDAPSDCANPTQPR